MNLECQCGGCDPSDDRRPMWSAPAEDYPLRFVCSMCLRYTPWCHGSGGCCDWCESVCDECWCEWNEVFCEAEPRSLRGPYR